MTDYTDLIARLRAADPMQVIGWDGREAAAAIEVLQAENERLRALLSDLADAFENEAGRGSDLPEGYAFAPYVDARAALQAEKYTAANIIRNTPEHELVGLVMKLTGGAANPNVVKAQIAAALTGQ